MGQSFAPRTNHLRLWTTFIAGGFLCGIALFGIVRCRGTEEPLHCEPRSQRHRARRQLSAMVGQHQGAPLGRDDHLDYFYWIQHRETEDDGLVGGDGGGRLVVFPEC